MQVFIWVSFVFIVFAMEIVRVARKNFVHKTQRIATIHLRWSDLTRKGGNIDRIREIKKAVRKEQSKKMTKDKWGEMDEEMVKSAKMSETSENRSDEIVPMDRSHHKDAIVFVRFALPSSLLSLDLFCYYFCLCVKLVKTTRFSRATALQMCLRLIQFG